MTKAQNIGGALLAYFAREGEGVALPRGVNTLEALALGVTEAGQMTERGAVNVERAYLALALAIYARTPNADQVSPSKALAMAVEMAPMQGTEGTQRQRRTIIKAALMAHTERFQPQGRDDDAALIGQALNYARGVDCRAERDARAEASKAEREAKGDKRKAKAEVSGPLTSVAIAEANAETLAETAREIIARLQKLAGEGDAIAVAVLASIVSQAAPAQSQGQGNATQQAA